LHLADWHDFGIRRPLHLTTLSALSMLTISPTRPAA